MELSPLLGERLRWLALPMWWWYRSLPRAPYDVAAVVLGAL